MKKRTYLLAVLPVTGALAVAAVALPSAGQEDDDTADTDVAAPAAAAPATRRDLVEETQLDGTLQFADRDTLRAQGTGTVTALPAEGSVVEPGASLYEVDGRPVTLFQGTRPAWRDFYTSMSDGEDVRQLESNLVTLGYDPDAEITIDTDFDAATSAAIKRWQEDLGVAQTGEVSLGRVVFLPGTVRVGEHEVAPGTAVTQGTEVYATTGPSREVTVRLDPNDQDLVAVGDTVGIDLPDGSRTSGTVASVGAVVHEETGQGGEDDSTYLDLIVVPDDDAALGDLAEAPVDVAVTTSSAENVLTVPVEALLAVAEGGYAVERVEEGGGTALVRVDLGAFASGYVEVEGDLSEGDDVVVPE